MGTGNEVGSSGVNVLFCARERMVLGRMMTPLIRVL